MRFTTAIVTFSLFVIASALPMTQEMVKRESLDVAIRAAEAGPPPWKREAEAEAEAGPPYWRREAEAGPPYWKREAEAEAEAGPPYWK